MTTQTSLEKILKKLGYARVEMVNMTGYEPKEVIHRWRKYKEALNYLTENREYLKEGYYY